ncbi:MAG: Asp-tRNA(Asn)/Glu-tRNA(Gln) amidotransferase subunit GatC [Actinobacteria bacterium]|nr:MAG: Asp-tRNA(Asn)/Glu-tRNA(Gln) amidotransferase subunit GatC [Actinomycetota bacterium]
MDRRDVLRRRILQRIDRREVTRQDARGRPADVAYADQVTALATEDVPPTSHALPLKNVFRPDEIGPCLSQEKALSTAPEVEQGRFKVPRIMEEP